MQTSCPECGTTVRVSQEQLGLRRGLVRCGHCGAVFNAYDTLLPELENAPPETEVTAVAEIVAAIDAPEAAEPQAPREEATVADVQAAYQAAGIDVAAQDALNAYAETAALPEEPAGGAPEADPGTAALAAEVAEASWQAPEETPDTILLSDLPNRRAEAGPRLPAWKKALYLLLILLFLVSLLGQLAYFLRGELATALPESRPLLNAFCRSLGCEVPLPRQLTPKAIVSSSLEHDPEQVSRVRLSFLLTNRTGQTQAWPHVILTLSDVRESPVAQKAFPPEDYLPPGTSVRAGFPAQSEQEARVDLDIGNLAAASYVISIAYP